MDLQNEIQLKTFVNSFFSKEDGEYYLEEDYERIKKSIIELLDGLINTIGCGCSDVRCPRHSRISPIRTFAISQIITGIKRYSVHPLLKILSSREEYMECQSLSEARLLSRESDFSYIKVKTVVKSNGGMLAIPRFDIIENIVTDGKVLINGLESSHYPLISNLMPFMNIFVHSRGNWCPEIQATVCGVMTKGNIFLDQSPWFLRTDCDKGILYMNGSYSIYKINSLGNVITDFDITKHSNFIDIRDWTNN